MSPRREKNLPGLDGGATERPAVPVRDLGERERRTARVTGPILVPDG
jgi:hypothetical protein